MTSATYQRFIQAKLTPDLLAGISVTPDDCSPVLYPFQRQLVAWAARKGRTALFADTGLGKTLMMLEWARLMDAQTLIVAPLAVAQQTIAEADNKLGLTVRYARKQSDVSTAITVTNYEMIDRFDPEQFGAVVLDESSILKSIDSKTREKLITLFARTNYRLCATATPAPNDIAELANHAEFLGVCTREEMLSMFFVHDDQGWRLKGHAKDAFYQWLAAWAVMVKHPRDIGFDDASYDLPPLNVEPLWIVGDAQKAAQETGQLFSTGLKGLTGRTAARKATVGQKVEAGAELVNNSNEQWLVWCGLNEEGRQMAKAVSGAVLIEGKDPLERKIEAIQSFLSGGTRVLISKPSIFGFGLNMQHCHNMLFLGLNDSYETYYQAIRRCWRYGQQHPVNVYIAISDLEEPILENVQRKEDQAAELSQEMVRHISEYQKQEIGVQEQTNGHIAPEEANGNGWRMLRGDCVERLQELEDNSIDFSVFSPPFLSLYTYTDSPQDMGNSRNDDQFFEHFRYFLGEMLRVTKPGRNVACHVAQVPTTLVNDGVIGIKDFRGKTIDAFERAGFVYHGEVCIDKDPQAQAIRTHSKGLLFVQLKRDAAWLRPALADYLLIFRKPGENAVPVLPDISNEEWIEWARPIWYNIRESDTLQVAEARTDKDERHICPLQLGTIERAIRLWTNKGETVLSPFAGIGSEGYEALLHDRQFVGIELKESYFTVACRNLERATVKKTQGVLL